MISEPFVTIPIFTAFAENGTHNYDFEGMNISKEHLERFVHQMNDHLSKAWATEIASLKKILAQREVNLRNELDPLRVEF